MPQKDEPQKGSVVVKQHEEAHRHPVLKRVFLTIVLFIGSVFFLNTLLYTIGIKSGFFHRWSKGQEAGVVTDIENGSFSVTNHEGVKKTIVVNEKTIIKKEREVVGIAGMQKGLRVIIIGSEQSNGDIEAQTVRIFEDHGRRGGDYYLQF